VAALDGRFRGVSELFHPHDAEQPFTRSLGGVAIPADVSTVVVRAYDLVHGFSGHEETSGLTSK
jgi:hypothetical protein